jgi:hypothetical protein
VVVEVEQTEQVEEPLGPVEALRLILEATQHLQGLFALEAVVEQTQVAVEEAWVSPLGTVAQVVLALLSFVTLARSAEPVELLQLLEAIQFIRSLLRDLTLLNLWHTLQKY